VAAPVVTAGRVPVPRPVRFASNGRTLFGMLHDAAAPRPAAGGVFLNAGPQNRVGPQRIYVEAARRFAAAGYVCLRIDLPGVGESTGDFPDNNLDCHDPANVRGAVDLVRATGAERVVLLGLCVGARVAVRAALADERVATVVSWSAPIISGAPDIIAEAISHAAARGQVRHWSRRLLQPRRWRRYVTSAAARREALTKLRSVGSTLLRREPGGALPRFVREMGELLSSRRAVLVAYGERDIGPRSEFESHLGSLLRADRPDRRWLLVPGGDHTYAALAARDRVIAETLGWLAERHPR
jgi:pimeloyl-ACP methyl ester carboxylesterase